MNEKDLAKYMKDRKALVVDFSSSRSSVRRLLNQTGMKSTNVDVAEDWKEAEAKIRGNPPEIVFAEYTMGDKCGLELLSILRSVHQKRLDIAFFVMTDSNSDTIGSAVAEEEADALIIRPFSFGTLQQKFMDVIERKSRPGASAELVESGRALAEQGKFEDAIKALEQAKSVDPKAVGPYFQSGLVYSKAGDFTQARSSFEGGLKIQPTHYKCLGGLLDLLLSQNEKEQAYEVARILTKYYPVPPKRIPDLVRLSVVNYKYEDILNYYEVFSRIDNIEKQLVTYISAGLVVCGKYLIRKQNHKGAAAALKRAQDVCEGRPQILSEVISTYIAAGMGPEVQIAFKSVPDDLKSLPDFKILELRITNLTDTAPATIQFGTNLLRDGVKAPVVFEIVLTRGKETGKKSDWLEPFVTQASTLYPDQAEKFKAFLETPDAKT